MIDTLISIALVCGTFFTVTASLGLLRMPDVYSRLHAVTKATTLGTAGVLAGSALHALEAGHGILPEVLTVLFVALTNPVGAHMIARSAYLIGIRMADISVIDEMQRAGEHAHTAHDKD